MKAPLTDYSRKIGAKSGIVGVDAPKYVEDGGGVVSCSVTVKKRFPDGYVGDFTAEPDFKEYSTGKNLWATKPKTMIAKVAEMHALRKACPEELSQSFVEEELARADAAVTVPAFDTAQLAQYTAWIKDCKTKEELERVWADIPGDYKARLKDAMEEVKAMIISASADVS